MLALLNELYYKLRKEEIEKARVRLRRIKIDTILHNLTRLCWKNNIQYEIIIKTSDILTIKLTGTRNTILFKYHKEDMVSREDVDFFMSELDENKAHKGIYLTTGEFERPVIVRSKGGVVKRDCILEDSFTFIKRHLGLKGKVINKFNTNNLNFFKYLPQ